MTLFLTSTHFKILFFLLRPDLNFKCLKNSLWWECEFCIQLSILMRFIFFIYFRKISFKDIVKHFSTQFSFCPKVFVFLCWRCKFIISSRLLETNKECQLKCKLMFSFRASEHQLIRPWSGDFSVIRRRFKWNKSCVPPILTSFYWQQNSKNFIRKRHFTVT